MKWLFVTTQFPWPILHGRWLRVYHLARQLCAQGDEVSVLSCQADDPGIGAYNQIKVKVIPGPQRPHIGRGPARCWLGPYAFDNDMARALDSCASQFDTIVLSGSRMLQYAQEASAAPYVVAEFVDDPVLEMKRRLWHTFNPIRGTRRIKELMGQSRYERAFLDRVTVSTFVSEQDGDSFSRRHPHRPVAFVPNGVDIEYFHRPRDYPRKCPAAPTIVFTGYMGNPNNEWAAMFLVQKVAPVIWRSSPQARIQIVGANPSEKLRHLAEPRVQITGHVDDIRLYLWDADVVLIPMQSGTGIKNKLLEAWAAGAAVVASPLACQGVPVGKGKNLLLGTSPQELGDCVIQLLKDESLRRSLAADAQRTVREHLTWSVVTAKFRETIVPSGAHLRQDR